MSSSTVMIVKKHKMVIVVGFLLGGLLACVQWNWRASGRLDASSDVNTRTNFRYRKLYFNGDGKERNDKELLEKAIQPKSELVGGGAKGEKDRSVTINQIMIDELSLLWLFDELKLEVRLSCGRRLTGVFTDDVHLVVCLQTDRLQRTVSAKSLTRFQAKLLVLKNIIEDLGGDGYAMFLNGNKVGERSLDFDEQVVDTLEKLMARIGRSGSQLKRIEPRALAADAHKTDSKMPGNYGSQDRQDLDIERAFDLSFLNQPMESDYYSESTGEPRSLSESPTKAYSSKRTSSVLHEDDKKGGQIGFHLPKNLIKQFKQQTRQGGAYRPWSQGRSISKNMGKNIFISPSLAKLQGYTFPRQPTLLERGFHEPYSFTSTQLQRRMSNITQAVGKVSPTRRNAARTSLEPNLITRGKYQNQQLRNFCTKASLPNNIYELDGLFKHLLYDDERRVVFCYVPKNGCSNMKRTFLIMNGILPANSSKISRPPESLLGEVNSFRGLTREGALYRLNNYYKFAILRNPLERLLSAYRNKLESPLNFTLIKKFPHRLKAYILTLTNRHLIEKWAREKRYGEDIHPTFRNTLEFLTKFNLSSYNEHFAPFLELCQPCAIKYDVYLNLKTINYDIFALMEYLGIPLSYYPPVPRSEMTKDHMKEYFGRIPASLKEMVFDRLHKELEFYYKLHPEEAGMHFNL